MRLALDDSCASASATGGRDAQQQPQLFSTAADRKSYEVSMLYVASIDAMAASLDMPLSSIVASIVVSGEMSVSGSQTYIDVSGLTPDCVSMQERPGSSVILARSPMKAPLPSLSR